jgi:hypothetical protein
MLTDHTLTLMKMLTGGKQGQPRIWQQQQQQQEVAQNRHNALTVTTLFARRNKSGDR